MLANFYFRRYTSYKQFLVKIFPEDTSALNEKIKLISNKEKVNKRMRTMRTKKSCKRQNVDYITVLSYDDMTQRSNTTYISDDGAKDEEYDNTFNIRYE